MFQFTTTNVINSLVDSTSGKDLVEQLSEGRWHVKRIGTFDKKFIESIYKAPFKKAINARANISLADLEDSKGETIKKGDQLRLNMYIGLTQGSNNSLYANDTWFKGKPFFVDFTYTGDKDAEKLAKVIKKYMLAIHGEKMVEVIGDNMNLIVDAVNEYQRFRKLQIEKLIPEAYNGMGDYEVLKSLEDLTPTEVDDVENLNTVANDEIFVGQEGFGTYSWILHNLRLPTYANSRFLAIDGEEAPIPGALYNQYTVHMCVNRGTLGMNAVGDQVTSHTVHVFYVKDDLREKFEEFIKDIAPEEKREEKREYPEVSYPDDMSEDDKKVPPVSE